jgi:phosphatidylethanolamine-binding protein (PEBP) family uncharacterized protein
VPRHAQQASTLTLTARALALAGALLALLLAGGCGESTKTAASASATTSTGAGATQAAAATTTSGAATAPRASTAGPAAHPGAAASSAHGGRPHRRAGSVLASLGSAKPAPRLSAGQRAHTSRADIELSSPVLARGSNGAIPSQYTCDGANHSLPLRWEGVPPGTAELAIFAISTTPVHDKLFFDWALAHINPNVSELQSGQLPLGAVQGQNSNGQTAYTICPPPGKPESYVFLLYALPHTLSPTPAFNAQALHQQALQSARHSGLLVATYKRH